jgi:hypothetical protein
MATCEGCGCYRYSETRVSGLCKKCWCAGGSEHRRVPIGPGTCVVCKGETPLTEGYERRKIAWVMDFLGGPLCLRCHIGFSHFARDMPATDATVIGWLARQLVRKGRHQRKAPQARNAHAPARSPEWRAKIAASLRRPTPTAQSQERANPTASPAEPLQGAHAPSIPALLDPRLRFVPTPPTTTTTGE